MPNDDNSSPGTKNQKRRSYLLSIVTVQKETKSQNGRVTAQHISKYMSSTYNRKNWPTPNLTQHMISSFIGILDVIDYITLLKVHH